MSGVQMLHFLKDWWKFIQIHEYYTMAFTHKTQFDFGNIIINFCIYVYPRIEPFLNLVQN